MYQHLSRMHSLGISWLESQFSPKSNPGTRICILLYVPQSSSQIAYNSFGFSTGPTKCSHWERRLFINSGSVVPSVSVQLSVICSTQCLWQNNGYVEHTWTDRLQWPKRWPRNLGWKNQLFPRRSPNSSWTDCSKIPLRCLHDYNWCLEY